MTTSKTIVTQGAVQIGLSDFLGAIFEVEDGDGEIVFAQQVEGGTPGAALEREMFERKALAFINGKSRKASAFYMGTSTVHRDADGRLRNRNDNFALCWCLVLDDVGTKVAVEDLPEYFRSPSWIIESSPGNYQYGFIYEDVIAQREVAQAVLDQVTHAVGADTGGNLACKLVRLPLGVNVKTAHADADGALFRVQLQEFWPERLFPAAELMVAAGCSVTWEDLLDDVAGAVARDQRRTLGTTGYRRVSYHAGGVVDEVAEWLIEQGMVDETNGPWWRIRCPWWREHSNTDDPWAGYAPLGASDGGKGPDCRAFHCFHSHEHRTDDFLRWVQQEGGPRAPRIDPVAADVAKWALDMESNQWIDFRSESLAAIRDSGFKTGHQEQVLVPGVTPSGEPRTYNMTKYQLIVQSPSLLRLSGVRYMPGEGAVIDLGGGSRVLNECAMPSYGRVEPDAGVIERVVDFIEYLIPCRRQSRWFLDHLAMKVQDPTYRGNAVLMTTPATGTGRGTLKELIGHLWGTHNLATPGWGNFLAMLSGRQQFNTELRRLWVVIEEMAAGDDPSRARDRENFELLKRFCDPGQVMFDWNRKYGAAWSEPVYSSVLLCSNHEDALWADQSDRRFVRIQNTMVPRSTAWFRSFIGWMRAGGWQSSLWWWLAGRDLSEFEPGANLWMEADTQREEVTRMSRGVFEWLTEYGTAYCDTYCGGVMCVGDLMNGLRMAAAGVSTTTRQWEALDDKVSRMLINATRSLAAPTQTGEGSRMIKMAGKVKRFRITMSGARDTQGGNDLSNDEVRDLWQFYDAERVRDYVLDRMREDGLDWALRG